MGSVGGLAAILRANGFDAQGIIPDPVPEKYTFLAEGVPLRAAAEGERFDGDLLIVCDCTDLSRMGKLKREQFSATVLIDIDHHLNNPHFGAENWVDTGAAAPPNWSGVWPRSAAGTFRWKPSASFMWA